MGVDDNDGSDAPDWSMVEGFRTGGSRPLPPECGHCGIPLVRDGSRYCSRACREEARALGDDGAFEDQGGAP